MNTLNIVASTNESTVVTEYIPETSRSDAYQSEAQLEQEFIRLLTMQGYEYIALNSEQEMISNLRKQLEMLNHYDFSDTEWERFFRECIASSNEGIVEKTRKIQTDHIQNLKKDDGSTKNIMLIDKKNIYNNRLQVVNQYEEKNGNHDTRYDVTILVNGLPMVHIELKRRGVAIREAFNQIKRYQRDSFWAGSGLYEYIQIFVISNGTHTKYYSNTTRISHIKESSTSGKHASKKTSNSFEFTSYWADGKNKVISDLIDFTKTFFARYTILNILTRYCVFTAEELLLVMRPYQISATEKILNRIEISTNYKKTGTVEAGGYIWHTTGSGKTLTSFKTAQLATALPYVDKVLFVVDRKDLDYQTMKEYDRFEKGSANSNKSTKILQRQLETDSTKIIITTIQKLDHFIRRNKTHEIYRKHVVIIFDECHRSQFGDMHTAIIKAFQNYHIFGFTGTPIFSENAPSSSRTLLKTTPQAFGDKLHTYTIVNAINDGNVLPFRIDYVDTVKKKEEIVDRQVKAIDIEKAMEAPERVEKIVSYILEHFDQKTQRNSFYSIKGQRVAGFNSIFAVSSIPMAKKYYIELKKQLEKSNRKLTIATIFSYSANEEDPEDVMQEEEFETDGLDKTSRDFLQSAIDEYNREFKQSFDTSSEGFQNYYKDLSQRMKRREIDLLIVVNMFLTGFDATTLNTLWVDKNLKMHGLIQAFSRTNRILNSVKTYGNIVCFRDLQKETDEAIALFGDENAESIVLLKNYEAYYYGYDEDGKHHAGYIELIEKLKMQYPVNEQIVGEQNQKDFISLFGAILRLKNILSSFDKFDENEILTQRQQQEYQSIYLDLYQDWKKKDKTEKENINDDIVFEMELVRQVEINIDYILMLVSKYHDSNCEDKEILVDIRKAVDSSMQLRSKKELIENFIENVNVNTKVEEDWQKFVTEQKETDISELIKTERLKDEDTRRFIDNSFRDGVLKTTGTDIDRILPPVSRFSGGNRAEKKQTVIDKLMKFFEKYFGLIS
ncbi:type I restriction endonuclease subunit R [Clostridioides difficile]|uniref:type I restriction endonuclease subunit R n=1 Tax=Clostridia TaxID=186801 RepID=UPI000D1EFD71|nr:type I restriction endonuclease subunit R [Clostridioides difficile]MDL5065335.1 type I restriction endonuclease subunit R [Clostridioides difficile]MDN9452477.1 type I restriction endonuclease subunit R [Clostridioides difficile]HBF7897572.1 type I restriction endonuclease subunit R [Clostridioides difficile]